MKTLENGPLQQQTNDMLIPLTNVVLVVCTIALAWIAISLFQKQVDTITLRETRFLTVEWNLLKEFKVQMDKLLLEKDREINTLRQQYRDLKQQGYSGELLKELDILLKKAESDREAILSSRITGVSVSGTVKTLHSKDAAKTTPTQTDTLDAKTPALPPFQEGTTTVELLGQKIQSLELQVKILEALQTENEKKIQESSTKILEATREIERYKAENQTLRATLSAVQSTIPAPPAASASEKPADPGFADETIELLEQKIRDLDKKPPPKLEDLRALALVRAILSTPSIRSTYPDLTESFDRSFNSYGHQERIKGQKEAYQAMLEYLRSTGRKHKDK